MAFSVICGETQSRVSSVLNRDVKQFGKKYLFDHNEETCWNSDQGENQWLSLEFPSRWPCHSYRSNSREVSQRERAGWKVAPKVESLQRSAAFTQRTTTPSSFPIQEAPVVDKVKIIFENSADFFGRIIVYSLDILGEKAL